MQILVVILSVFLAIFLVLAIILTIQLIRVTKQIQDIATDAQTAIDRVSNLAATATRFISPAVLVKMVSDMFGKRKKSKKEDA